MSRRSGVSRILSCLLFDLAGLDLALAIGLHVRYPAAMLPGTLLTDVGVGLTLPTLTATATSSLPRERFATGSAVFNMARQIGFTLGVAILVAVLGNPHTPDQYLHAYRHGWEVGAVLALVAGSISAFLIRRPQPAPALSAAAESAQ